MFRLAFADRVKFLLERLFVRGAHYQLLAVAALIGLISLLGGLLVLPAGEPTPNLHEAIWWAFLRLTDPGYLGDDAGAWRRVVSTLLTVMGYVLFMGSLVAILTQWLNGKMRQLEQGLTPVAARGHIVILGWTNRTLPVLRELVLSTGRLRRFLKLHGTRRLRVVILDEEVSARRGQAVRDDAVIRPYSRDVILRSGSRLNADHLHRAACFQASAILMPTRAFGHQNQVGADVETIKALMSLDARARELNVQPPYVVAEIQDIRKLNVARGAYGGPLEVIAGDAAMSRLMAQNIRHPGLSVVFTELLSHGSGNEFYILEAGALSGHSLAALEPRFPHALPCGLVRPGEEGFRPLLNAAPSETVRDGDRLVLLAPSLQDAQPAPGARSRDDTSGRDALTAAPHRPVAQRRILVLGWNHTLPALLAELGSYPGERFSVTILSTLGAEARRRILALYHPPSDNLSVTQEEGDFLDEATLRAAAPGEYDHVILASSDRLPSGEEADARSIVGHLLLDQVLGEGRRPQVLLELSDPGNASLLPRGATEVLVAPMLLSHMLAQVALRRELRAVFDELFTAGGPEIHFRDLRDYEASAGTMDFSAARRLASRYGETAIGIHCPGAENAVRLNPPRQTPFRSVDGDLLVVIGGQ